MKRTDITSLLKEILTENEDNLNREYLATLKGFLESRLIPTINRGIDIDGISQEFADRLISDIRKVLDEVNSGKSAIRGVKESAISPGYLTNIYSDDQRLEATVYKDGVVSITVRDAKGNIKKSTAAVPLAQLQDSIEKLGTGLDTVKVNNFVEKVMNNEKVQSVKNLDNN